MCSRILGHHSENDVQQTIKSGVGSKTQNLDQESVKRLGIASSRMLVCDCIGRRSYMSARYGFERALDMVVAGCKGS